jgi:hypothetical protein
MIATFTLVYLAMSAQVGDNGEVSAATFNFTGKWLFASMAVHMSLERAWSREALVTDFALVLLLRA